MPLETASYISQLVPSNPAADDALATTQNHLQLLKTVLQTQFPSLGAAAVEATAADLYAGIGTDVTNLKTNAVIINGTSTATQSMAGGLTVGATLSAATIAQNGNPLVPAGVVVMWSGASTAIPAGWVLCDGTNSTPDLRSRFVIGAGSAYSVSATGGASAVTASTSTAGAHSHGSATASSGPWSLSASCDVQGAHSHGGGVGGTALTTDQLPAHSHGYGVAAVALAGGGSLIGVSGSQSTYQTTSVGSGNVHGHSITTDGSHQHNIGVSSAPAHSHGITTDGGHSHTVSLSLLPPYFALCFIMKT